MKKVYFKPVFRELFMRRIPELFEFGVSAALLFVGLYMLYEGSANNSTSDAAILIGGAVCFTLGVMTLVSAVRCILRRRRMLRQSIPKNYLEGAAPETR